MRPHKRIFLAWIPLFALVHVAACTGGVEIQVRSTNSTDTPPLADRTGTGTATLAWLPPTANTDGSVLVDLAGYRIYRGWSPTQLTLIQTVSNPGTTRWVVDGLPEGLHFFAVSAYSTAGLESELSQTRSISIR
jgi:hypothetical protein